MTYGIGAADLNRLARALAGGRVGHSSESEVAQVGRTRIYEAQATSDSSDGTVSVAIPGDVVSGDGAQSQTLPTSVEVREGDVVEVTVVNGSPMVTGVVGRGDQVAASLGKASSDAADAVKAASDAAGSARAASESAASAEATARDSCTVSILSTAGSAFRNDRAQTVLQAAVFPAGGGRIETRAALRERFGVSARIEWRERRDESDEWSILLATDSRISHDGFWLAVGAQDFDDHVSFEASVITD